MAYADDKLPLIDFSPDYLTSLSLGLVDHGFIMLAQRLPPTREDRVYPKFKSDWERGIDVDGFGDYVVITPCYTSVVRMFPGTEVNKLIQGIHALGFKTALLGNTTKISTGNGHKLEGGIPEGLDLTLPSLNLINQTSLIDALNIMAHAKCVVGVDNGLLHLAACTDTPSVWGFTTVEKELRLPEGIKAESVLPDEVYGCQSKTYLVEHDFTKCMFDTCLCVSGMKAEKFLQGVKKVLDLS
jgi:ADP-heptose:LPS heptosyltransferase